MKEQFHTRPQSTASDRVRLQSTPADASRLESTPIDSGADRRGVFCRSGPAIDAGDPGFGETMTLPRIFQIFVLLGFLGQVNLAYAQEKWLESRSRHFVVYSKQAPADFIQNVVQTAERYYEEITRNLGFTRYAPWGAANQLMIYIYDDQEDYLASGQQQDWSHAVTLYRQKEIRTFPSDYGFFDSILPHELGHIIFREFVGDNPSIPLWLDEGVAMFQEKAKRWGAHKIVQRSLRDSSFMPLEQLSQARVGKETPRPVIELFYAESASVVYYMISDLGQQRFVNLCRRLQEGMDFWQAMRKIYPRFRTLGDLNTAWKGYLDQQ